MTPPATQVDLTYIGIDPGASGAIAVLHPENLAIYDIPVLKTKRCGKVHTEIDSLKLFQLLRFYAGEYPAARVVLEKVGGLPKQSASAAFNFGRTFGLIEGACMAAGLPVAHVAPGAWKAGSRLIGKGATYAERKTASRELASQLWPYWAQKFSRVKDDGRAEAALLARYGALNGL